MTVDEKLTAIMKMQCRLFWLVTQAPGVARYVSDVELFTKIQIELGMTDVDQGNKLIEGYKLQSSQSPEY